MQVCSIWKCTKGLVLVLRLLQCVGLCPGEVITVNTEWDLHWSHQHFDEGALVLKQIYIMILCSSFQGISLKLYEA